MTHKLYVNVPLRYTFQIILINMLVDRENLLVSVNYLDTLPNNNRLDAR